MSSTPLTSAEGGPFSKNVRLDLRHLSPYKTLDLQLLDPVGGAYCNPFYARVWMIVTPSFQPKLVRPAMASRSDAFAAVKEGETHSFWV